MAKMNYEQWSDQMLDAQIQGTIRRLDTELNIDYKIGFKEYLERLLKEREKRAIKRTSGGNIPSS